MALVYLSTYMKETLDDRIEGGEERKNNALKQNCISIFIIFFYLEILIGWNYFTLHNFIHLGCNKAQIITFNLDLIFICM